MQFLADENFRFDVIKFLISTGNDVIRINPGSSDKTVAVLAKKEKRILLTQDTDFSITLNYPPKEYYGILIFRIHPPCFEHLKQALIQFFSTKNKHTIKRKTFLINRISYVEIE